MKISISKILLLLIRFIFIVTYVIYETGYYEYKLQNRMVLTSEQMKQFEIDVNSGKDVTLNDYLVDEQIDYSNKLTNITVKVNNKVGKYLKKSIEGVFKLLNGFVSSN